MFPNIAPHTNTQMIAFKWNAFAKRMFLRDLGLSVIYSAAFPLSVVFRLEDEAERAGSLLGLIVTAGGLGHKPRPHITTTLTALPILTIYTYTIYP